MEEIQQPTKKYKLETVLDRTQQMHGDRFRTGEVITNLLSNAITYSPDADKIIITSKVEDEKVTVSIRDFGIGIEEELQNYRIMFLTGLIASAILPLIHLPVLTWGFILLPRS